MEFRRGLLKLVVPEFIWPKEVSIDGIKFLVRNTPYSFGIKYFLTKSPQDYESPERYFLRYLMPGDHVIELGSSIGVVTRLIREKIGANGKLIAVEASPRLSSFSKTWLEKFSNISILTKFGFPTYLRTEIGFHFDDTRGSLGGTIIFDNNEEKRNGEESFFIEDAEKDFGMRPNVMVCDIEGSEIVLLQKEAFIPDYIHSIIIELHPSIYSIDNMIRIIERIKSFGFTLHSSIQSVYFFKRIN